MPSASSGIFNLLVFQPRMETRVEAGPQPGPTCGSAGETPLEQQGLGLTFYYNTHSHFCLQNIVLGLLDALQSALPALQPCFQPCFAVYCFSAQPIH